MKKSIDWLKKNTITLILVVLAVVLTGCFEKEEDNKELEPKLSGDVAAEEQFDVENFFNDIDEMFKETTGSFTNQEIKELYNFDNVTTNDMRCYVVEDGEK